MSDESPITQAEVAEIFGASMPLDAARLLMSPPVDITTAGLRTRLREMAAAQITAWNGLPPNPTVSGPHWLRCKRFSEIGLAEWTAECGHWTVIGDAGALPPQAVHPAFDYIAPCATPDEVAALQAEVRRRGDILRAILEADERGQGLPFAEAMDVAKVAIS
jgi:hypothetical protein